MGTPQTSKSKQKLSIHAKRTKMGGSHNPNANANLLRYADILNLSKEEWAERMLRSKAIKAAIQHNLVQVASDAGIEDLLKEAIQERSVEKADLLERICKIIGCVFREQTPSSAMQVNVTSGDAAKPLSVKFVDAQEVSVKADDGTDSK